MSRKTSLRIPGRTARMLKFLRRAGDGRLAPNEISHLADQALQQTPAGHPLRPAVLLAAAGVYHRVSDARAALPCLEEFFALRSRWHPGEKARELAAVEYLMTALCRLGRRREAIPLADQAAVLALLAGRMDQAVRWLRHALHLSLAEGDAGAGSYLRRLADLLPAAGSDGPTPTLAVDQAWLHLADGQFGAAVRLVQDQWQNPAADPQVRAQALWVASEAALALGQEEAATQLHQQATRLAVQAGWELGFRLCSRLAARLAAGGAH